MANRQTAKTPLDAIAQHLDALSQADRLEVQAMLEALLTSTEEPADTNERGADDPEVHRGPKSGRGHIEVKLIPDNKRGKSYGPYRYLRYWQEGKLKTRYLGKANA